MQEVAAVSQNPQDVFKKVTVLSQFELLNEFSIDGKEQNTIEGERIRSRVSNDEGEDSTAKEETRG